MNIDNSIYVNKDNRFTVWVKKHKKGILIAGGLIAIGGLAYALNRKCDFIKPTSKFIKSNPSVINNTPVLVDVARPVENDISAIATEFSNKNINGGEEFLVRAHIRNLAKGLKPSAEKIALALKQGLKLAEHQTFVESYSKNCA